MQKINNILNKLEEYFAAASLFFISLLIFSQAVLRYGFNISFHWSEEVARYMIIWIVYIGSSIAVREKAHAAVDLMTIMMPVLMQRIISSLVNAIGITFCIITLWSGSIAVINAIENNTVTASIEVSMAWPYLAIPVGSLLMLIRFLQLLFKDIKSIIFKNYKKTSLTEGATKQ